MKKLTMRQVRGITGLSQKEFAKKIGMSMASLLRRENGKTKWTLEEVHKVCLAFNIDPGDLALIP